MDLKQTETFRKWQARLKDNQARIAIVARLARLVFGHTGDVKPVGGGLSELRIDHGPGYRIYFHRRGNTTILLLCGGNKDSQEKDIKLAKRLAEEWSEQDG